jgi:hypothetical protein
VVDRTNMSRCLPVGDIIEGVRSSMMACPISPISDIGIRPFASGRTHIPYLQTKRS